MKYFLAMEAILLVSALIYLLLCQALKAVLKDRAISLGRVAEGLGMAVVTCCVVVGIALVNRYL